MFIGGLLASTGYALAPVSTARENALHLVGFLGRRPDAAPARQISVFHAHQLDLFAAAPSARAMGLRQRLQEGDRHRGRLCLRLRDGGGFQKAFEDCGGKVIQKIWPPLGTKDFGPYIPTIKADADAHLHRSWSARWRCNSPSSCALPATRSRSSAAASATTNSCCRSWATK